jgi:hypothetical protein
MRPSIFHAKPVSMIEEKFLNKPSSIFITLIWMGSENNAILSLRIPWRGDSSLGDQGNNGEDLTGGYHDGKAKHCRPMVGWAEVGTICLHGAHTKTSKNKTSKDITSKTKRRHNKTLILFHLRLRRFHLPS